MREHIRILGILNLIMGCLTAFGAVVVFAIMGGLAGVITASGDPEAQRIGAPLMAGIGVAIAVFLLILSAPTLIGGWGLLKFKPWSRILMIIVSIFELFHVPLGTALGVYGLWVLFNDEARRILESGGQLYFPAPGYPATTVPPQQPTYPPPGV